MGHSVNATAPLTLKCIWTTVNTMYAWQKAIDIFCAKLWKITLKYAKLLGYLSKTGGNFPNAVSNFKYKHLKAVIIADIWERTFLISCYITVKEKHTLKFLFSNNVLSFL